VYISDNLPIVQIISLFRLWAKCHSERI